ncbi:hypothetical protein SJAG_04801 [Schizosaccharomyces japonicus yFS275]|uniref:Uncharacterized protein n=1 Tax=Schizosaccharomyces japonicus (strain yFS275 / FY16936) TaxID=402676 RepID=B6K7T3_SCHJY|nr:hypothetical protein SJAG_04801 [Schizosaccharomyces japonicus yFS275]EEB09587.1 hypothetical protein SJAG_04801 [Schizosaccharomyces japonicus yFS275]
MKYKTYPPIAEGFSNNNTVFVFDNSRGNGQTCQQVGLYGYNASITFTAKCTNDGAFSYLIYDMFGVDYTSNITSDTGISSGFGEYVVLNSSYGRIYSKGIYSTTLNNSLTEWTVNLPGAGNYCTNLMPLRYEESFKDCAVKIRYDGVTPPANTFSSTAFRVTPLLLPVVISIFLTFVFAY